MSRELASKDYAALSQIRFEIRRFLNFSERMARDAGIEPQQHQLLLALRALPEDVRPTIGVLSRRLMVQHHSAVELVSRSVKAGLVRRVRGTVDRREITLKTTAKGQRLLAALSVAHRAELRSAAPNLLTALSALVSFDPTATPAEKRPPRRSPKAEE